MWQSAAAHFDIAVDPEIALGPVISDAAAAKDPRPGAAGAIDIGVGDPRRAAAGEVDDPDVAGGVEPARRPADGVANGRGDRPDRGRSSGAERLDHAIEHLGIERRIVGGEVADQGERPALDTEVISAAEPGALGGRGSEPRVLSGQLHPTIDAGERALVADVAGEGGEAVGAGGHGRDRHPAAAIEVGQGLVKAGLGVESGGDDVDMAGWAVEAVERDRALGIRMPRRHRDREVGAQVQRLAPSRHQPGAGDRGTALEAAAEAPLALNRGPDRPEGRGQRDGRIGDVDGDVGQLERLLLGGRRGKQFVDLAPADAPVHQPAAQPDAARDDAIDFEIAVPFEAHLHLGQASGEVGPLGIADDEIADLLRAEADAVERVSRGDPAALEFAREEVRRDWAPLDPHDRNHHRNKQQEAEGRHAENTRPAALAHNHRARAVVHALTPQFVHWFLLTDPAQDRSESGMTASLPAPSVV